MALSVSTPVRIAAICGLLATVVIFGGLKMVGPGGGSDSVSEPKIIRHHPFGSGVTKKPATTTHKPAAKAKPSKHVPPKPTVDLAAIKAARAAGLPESLAQAFGRYRVVVVSLYDPYSQVDGTAFAEAKAGASIAGVGFVPLNVLSQRDVGKLTEQLGLLPDPGVLVYLKPGTLAAKLTGFADKETVAQAATNVAHSA